MMKDKGVGKCGIAKRRGFFNSLDEKMEIEFLIEKEKIQDKIGEFIVGVSYISVVHPLNN